MLPASVAVEQAMRSEIQTRSPREVVFYTESVDLVRFPTADLEADFVALLQKKYKDHRIDVIVAFGLPAMSFGQRHRTDIWPEVPMVFVSAGDRGLVDDRPAATTGIPIRFDVAGTLALARSLQPNARRIVVVAGVSEFDGYVADAIVEALKRQPEKLEVRFLGDAEYP